ncbi:MAG: hypothetical protein IT530_07850 [Burkholderiales bacterium]|nr:hypothetical protein [Burkholderiales bacterium]
MGTGNRVTAFNLEQKLTELNLTPMQRAQAVGAMRLAEDIVDVVETLGAVVTRIASVFSPKPSVRA